MSLLMTSTLMPLNTVNVQAQQNIIWLWDGAQAPINAKTVAVVVKHLLLKQTHLLYRGRKSTPTFGSDMHIMPVVHVEVDFIRPPTVPYQYKDEIVQAVLSAAELSSSGWVQLDYEAPPSHSELYKSVVTEIKQQLPSTIKLSLTTLAWRCSGDRWLDELGADEIVPMFFKMGKDKEKINVLLAKTPYRLQHICQNRSAGFATQEAPSQEILKRYQRVYWFDYLGWKGKKHGRPHEAIFRITLNVISHQSCCLGEWR